MLKTSIKSKTSILKALSTAVLSSIFVFGITGCVKNEQPKSTEGKPIVRLGYFPNITHAQALIGVPRGDFQKALGDDAKLEASTFNAGPSVIQAIFANAIDIAYIGPSPTLNGFLKSDQIRVIGGAAANGTLVVANKNSGITKLEDLKGKRVATPQLGNTQDIAARDYLINTLGATLKDRGGDTEIIPLANPSIETSFIKGELDAAWVPEPWGSRLIDKGEGILIAEEKDLWPDHTFLLTNIIARKKFLEEHPDLVVKILEAHISITKELTQDSSKFEDFVHDELKRLTAQELPKSVIASAFKYTKFTWDPNPATFEGFFKKGKKLKFIDADSLDIDKLIEKSYLEDAIKALENQ